MDDDTLRPTPTDPAGPRHYPLGRDLTAADLTTLLGACAWTLDLVKTGGAHLPDARTGPLNQALTDLHDHLARAHQAAAAGPVALALTRHELAALDAAATGVAYDLRLEPATPHASGVTPGDLIWMKALVLSGVLAAKPKGARA